MLENLCKSVFFVLRIFTQLLFMRPYEIAQGIHAFFTLFHASYNQNKDIFLGIDCAIINENFENVNGYHGGRGVGFIFKFLTGDTHQQFETHHCLGDRCDTGCLAEN